jgi:hypothetical protein
MPATYEPIATTTLGSAASSITFSSIPGTYTDLRLVLVGKTSTAVNPYMRFNLDSGANYSVTRIYGNGSTAASTRSSGDTSFNLDNNSNFDTAQPALLAVDIFSYAGSTYKTCLVTISADKNGSGTVTSTVGLWSSTSAINSIRILHSAGAGATFDTGTVATLYGILKA